MAEPISVEAALARLTAFPVPAAIVEQRPLDAAIGRVLAEDVFAPIALPIHDQSAMDGYALAGGGRRFPLVGEATAGHPFAGPVAPGDAIRIMTGGVMPAGADRVAIQERCSIDGSDVVLADDASPGANVRRAGEDVARGERALVAGTLLTPWHIGMAAALGLAALPIRRPLRIALLSTGDELTRPGEMPGPGQIYDCNRPMIRALLRGHPVDVGDFGIVADDRDATRALLREAAAEHDLILTIGGMSVGDRDHVAAAIAAEGGFAFWNVSIKPGKPVALGHVGTTPVLGLPGNPVSAALCFLLFARPFIRHLAGVAAAAPIAIPATAGFARTRKPGRREYLRGRIENAHGRLVARPFAKDGSAMLSSLVWATGFIVVPEDAAAIEPGDPVDFLPFSGMM